MLSCFFLQVAKKDGCLYDPPTRYFFVQIKFCLLYIFSKKWLGLGLSYVLENLFFVILSYVLEIFFFLFFGF
jgi:hypothetical protein